MGLIWVAIIECLLLMVCMTAWRQDGDVLFGRVIAWVVLMLMGGKMLRMAGSVRRVWVAAMWVECRLVMCGEIL